MTYNIFSSRYGLGLFFDKPVNLGLDYDVKYVKDHSVIRFISIDNQKRGLEKSESPTSVVLHTSVEFGKEHVEKTPDEVKPILEKMVRNQSLTTPMCHQ